MGVRGPVGRVEPKSVFPDRPAQSPLNVIDLLERVRLGQPAGAQLVREIRILHSLSGAVDIEGAMERVASLLGHDI